MAGKKLPKGITQRKDGSYQARYSFRGKRQYIYDKNLKELEKKLRDALYEVEHGIHAKPEKVSFKSWFDEWIEVYKRPVVKKLTVDNYLHLYDKHIDKELGYKLLKDVRAEHIQKLFNRLYRDGYSKATISLVQIVLNSCLRQAVLNELIIKNPVSATVLPKAKERKKTKVLTQEEQELFRKYIKDTYQEAMFIIMLSTGMRVGEMCALTWKDISFKKEEITINKSLNYISPEVYTLGAPKTPSSIRKVGLLPKPALLLKKYRKQQLERKMSLGEKWEGIDALSNLVFTTEMGSPLNASRVTNEIKKVVVKINQDEKQQAKEENREPRYMESFTPHTFRHSFATRSLENEVDYNTLKELLGHSKITTTMDLYAHVLPNTKSKEVQKIAHLF